MLISWASTRNQQLLGVYDSTFSVGPSLLKQRGQEMINLPWNSTRLWPSWLLLVTKKPCSMRPSSRRIALAISLNEGGPVDEKLKKMYARFNSKRVRAGVAVLDNFLKPMDALEHYKLFLKVFPEAEGAWIKWLSEQDPHSSALTMSLTPFRSSLLDPTSVKVGLVGRRRLLIIPRSRLLLAPFYM